MHPADPPLREVVFELSTPSSHRIDAVAAAVAVRQLPGVYEAHVDPHGTWALVSFDPAVASLPSIIGCLGGHGLEASRMRSLQGSTDERPG